MAEFKLPDVGEGIDSGIVVNLMVAEGDSIQVDQPVLELETDKAVVEVPSSVSGVVESISIKANDEVKVGQTILTVGSSAVASDDAKKGESKKEKAEEPQAVKPETAKVQAPAASAQVSFVLPELGEGISGGTVVSILVAKGDTVEVDQPVIELETDKAVVEVPSSVTGIVESINVKTGEEATVGQAILNLSTSGSTPVKESKPESKVEVKTEAPPVNVEQRTATRSEGVSSERKLLPAAPSVRRLAREMGIDIAQIGGSGILGRISADDVRRFAEAVPTPQGTTAAPATPKFDLPDFSKWGNVERVPMTGIRKATVRSMTQAWATVPMVTHFDKADSTEFEVLRKRYKPKAEAIGASLTPTAMLLKIAAAALKKFPDFNASIDTEASEIIYKAYIHIGVAVDTPNGLLVPVIKNADQKNIIELAKELGDLAAKARDRKLSPDDMQGGNFNISNLGGIGGTGFTPIVNPPQVAILGVSRGSFEPVYNKETGSFDARMMMPLSLTYDHRLIDGAAAARFLRWVCEAIEEPFLMALEG